MKHLHTMTLLIFAALLAVSCQKDIVQPDAAGAMSLTSPQQIQSFRLNFATPPLPDSVIQVRFDLVLNDGGQATPTDSIFLRWGDNYTDSYNAAEDVIYDSAGAGNNLLAVKNLYRLLKVESRESLGRFDIPKLTFKTWRLTGREYSFVVTPYNTYIPHKQMYIIDNGILVNGNPKRIPISAGIPTVYKFTATGDVHRFGFRFGS